MKNYTCLLLFAAFVTACSCAGNSDTNDEGYASYDDTAVKTAPADYYYEDFSDYEKENPREPINASKDYEEVGKWKITDGYNIVIWSESGKFYCCAEVDDIKDLPGCLMEHSVNSDGDDTFSFANLDDGTEIYTVSDSRNTMTATDIYSGDQSTYYKAE